jgi:putative oxidoreductase
MTSIFSSSRADAALLLIRLVVGAVFIAHGAQKVFVFGLGGVTGGFVQMGIPLPQIAAPVVAFVELVGGAALVLGLFTHIAGVLLAIDMLGAMYFVHLKNGFFLPGGVEFPLTLCGVTAALAISGAGAYSVDALIARRRG